MEKIRIVYFDFLRIFAILAVVLAHAASIRYGMHYSNLFYYCILRWSVPIFVMISGALFLEPTKNITINNILTKYIFRIVIIFIVWSLFYTSSSCFLRHTFDFSFFVNRFVVGHIHMWFLYMIATLYLITPLLRPITEKKDKNLLLYLLIIWFIMTSVVSFIKFIIPSSVTIIDLIINTKMFFSFPVYFVGYFVLGYYLHNYVNIKNKFLAILIFLICTIIIILGDIKCSTNLSSFYTDLVSPFVVVTSICIFLLIKNTCSQIKQISNFILKLSGLTLGVYLIHPIFIKIASMLNFYNSINSLLNDKDFIAVPVVFIVVSICSFISVYLLSKIPIIKKYCL